MPTRLLCVTNDVSLPANSGGRVDIWRRMRALKAAGAELALVCWYDAGRSAAPTAEVIGELECIYSVVKIIPIERSAVELFSRAVNLGRMPSHAAARWVTTDRNGLSTWASTFKPDAVLLDGLYGGAVARWLSDTFVIPLFYRSHNVEHAYMRQQFQRADRFKARVGLLANRIGLARFERKTIRDAIRVFDISLDDCATWRAEGYSHVEWLPPLVDSDFVFRLGQQSPGEAIDVLYFGNLNTPNNVNGVLWLLKEVVPGLKAAQPQINIVIAGSHPVTTIIDAAKRLAVNLIENPKDVAPLLKNARVLVNPVFAGSGVNIKTVEMLFSTAYLVSTTQGLAGLPVEVTSHFYRADTRETFVETILNVLQSGVGPKNGDREAARQLFFSARAAGWLRTMEKDIEQYRTSRAPIV